MEDLKLIIDSKLIEMVLYQLDSCSFSFWLLVGSHKGEKEGRNYETGVVIALDGPRFSDRSISQDGAVESPDWVLGRENAAIRVDGY